MSLSPCFEAGTARTLPCQTREIRGAAKAGAPLVLLPSLEIRQHGSQNGRALGRHARHAGERHTAPTVRGRSAASPTRHSPRIVLVTAVDEPMSLQVPSPSHAPMENGIVFPVQERPARASAATRRSAWVVLGTAMAAPLLGQVWRSRHANMENENVFPAHL